LFTNQSEFGDSYLWDFGDNTTSTDENPVHVYAVDGIYSVSLTVTNECGETTVSNPVNTLNTGIDEADDISFNLYPNPATYELNLLASKAIRGNLTVDVVSTSGQLIRSEVVTGLAKGEITQVNINGLAQGIYYLRLVADQQQTVLRFDIIK
ncbi:MAG: T9SS type A sorting domain-containing protein, partial [Flavobacteriales bacterium]|nr:T9SS type A sorting domain-containing protein [Flavobacteriales bacterium]